MNNLCVRVFVSVHVHANDKHLHAPSVVAQKPTDSCQKPQSTSHNPAPTDLSETPVSSRNLNYTRVTTIPTSDSHVLPHCAKRQNSWPQKSNHWRSDWPEEITATLCCPAMTAILCMRAETIASFYKAFHVITIKRVYKAEKSNFVRTKCIEARIQSHSSTHQGRYIDEFLFWMMMILCWRELWGTGVNCSWISPHFTAAAKQSCRCKPVLCRSALLVFFFSTLSVLLFPEIWQVDFTQTLNTLNTGRSLYGHFCRHFCNLSSPSDDSSAPPVFQEIFPNNETKGSWKDSLNLITSEMCNSGLGSCKKTRLPWRTLRHGWSDGKFAAHVINSRPTAFVCAWLGLWKQQQCLVWCSSYGDLWIHASTVLSLRTQRISSCAQTLSSVNDCVGLPSGTSFVMKYVCDYAMKERRMRWNQKSASKQPLSFFSMLQRWGGFCNTGESSIDSLVGQFVGAEPNDCVTVTPSQCSKFPVYNVVCTVE